MGLAFIRKVASNTRIGLWRVDETPEELEEKLILNQNEKDFFQTLNKNKRNLHWLGSRVLLRTMINTPEFIELQNDENGKPYLVNFDWEISLSHSEEYAAAILSDHKAGIDVEQIRDRIRVIESRFLHPLEMKELGTNPSVERLFIHWCGKEALFKLYGKRQLSFRKNLYIKSGKASRSGTAEGFFVDAPAMPEGSFTIHYEVYEGYMFAWVVGKNI